MNTLFTIRFCVTASILLAMPSVSFGLASQDAVLWRSAAIDDPEVRVIDGSIEFAAKLKKVTLKSGESLSLDVSLKNLSDHRVILQNNWSPGAHLVIGIYDERGREVEYPGYNIRAKEPSPQYPKDFVVLDSQGKFVRHLSSGGAVPYAPKTPGEYWLRLLLSTENPETPIGKAVNVEVCPNYIFFRVKAKTSIRRGAQAPKTAIRRPRSGKRG